MRTRIASCALGAVLVAVSLSTIGCAALERPGKGTDSVGLEELREEINALRRQAAVAEVEVANLRRRVRELEGTKTGESHHASEARSPNDTQRPSPPQSPSEAPSRDRTVDLRSPAAEPGSVVPSPGAGSPEASRPMAVARSEIEEDELEDEPMAALPSSSPPASTSESGPSASSPANPPPASSAGTVRAVEVSEPILSPVTATARAAYDEAYTLYHEGSFAESEAKFLEFLAMGPANELSDNALFWVGSCRYARGDCPGALRAFRETVETYPGQNKVPDALLKIGQCLEQIGDRRNAEEVYRELATRFPDTAAATLASDRLANP